MFATSLIMYCRLYKLYNIILYGIIIINYHNHLVPIQNTLYIRIYIIKQLNKVFRDELLAILKFKGKTHEEDL